MSMDDRIVQFGLLDDDEIELDVAALELGRLDHRGIDLAPYEAVIDAIVARLADVGAGAVDATMRAEQLSLILARERGFVGDSETYDDPDNADLIRVIDRRRGLPVSLSILYVAAARRLGWPADALNVPGHVLVMIGDDVAPVVVDPFRAGMVVDAQSIANPLAAASSGAAPAVRHFATMSNRSILVRLLLNQATRAEGSGKGKRALTLYERMTAFAPEYPHAWWNRARLELTNGDISAGRRSLSAMLEISRDPRLRAKILYALGTLPA